MSVGANHYRTLTAKQWSSNLYPEGGGEPWEDSELWRTQAQLCLRTVFLAVGQRMGVWERIDVCRPGDQQRDSSSGV